jgi:anti-anti-sigma regulatory factor
VTKIATRIVQGVLIADLQGKFFHEADGSLIRDAVEPQIVGVHGVIINLEKVTHFSMGNYGAFGDVIGLYTTATNRGSSLKLLIPESPHGERIRETLRLYGLDALFEIYENEPDALSSFFKTFDDWKTRFSFALTVDTTGRIGIQVLEKFGTGNVSETSVVRPALHGIWLPDALLFPRDEIKSFEHLLNQSPPAPEAAFQEFLELHPRWLYLVGEQYEKAMPQVRLPPFEFRSTLALTPHPAADDAAMIPDFFVKRVGLELWDVLDIKTADARVVVGGKSRRHFSSAVAEATAQLREYSRRLRTPQIKQYLFERYQMTVSEPVAMVIVGRDFCFSSQVEKDQFREQDGVKVYTYDDLSRLAKRRAV